MHTYSLFNLNILSEIKFPNWHPGNTAKTSCVYITYGSVNPNGLQSAWASGFSYQMNSDDFWVSIPNIARFLISRGTHIIVDPIQRDDDSAITLFIEEICIDILLRQRQISVLPGYSFFLQNQGLAFAGRSNLASSILKGIFYKRGYEFMGDRYFAFSNDSQLLPGFPELQLSTEVASKLGLKPNQATPVREGIDRVKLPLHHHSLLPQPLDCLYFIKMSQEEDVRFMSIETSLQHRNVSGKMRQNLRITT